MTLPLTYTDIISAVQEELEDTGSEFVNYIPTSIRLAEERLNREIDVQGFRTVTTLTMTSGNNVLNKPTGHKLTYGISYVNSSNDQVVLEKRSDTFIRDFWPRTSLTDAPEYYSDIDNTQITLAPTPNSNYTVTWVYLKKPPVLTISNQTNLYTDNYPDLLFYATLVEQSRFARMYDGMKVFEEKYQQALAGVNEEGRRSRMDDSAPSDAPSISLNNLGRKP